MPDSIQGVTVMWTTDADGRITFASSNVLELTGRTLEGFAGRRWMECIHPDGAARTIADINAIISDPRSFSQFHFQVLHLDGHSLHVVAAGNPIFNVAGVCLGYVGTWTDVTTCENKTSRLPCLAAPSRLAPKARAVPLVSFDMDGTLCNTFQSWLDQATESDPTRMYDWRNIACNDMCHACESPFCVRRTDCSGPRQISRARLTTIKAGTLEEADYYTAIEPFDPADIELIKGWIDGGLILAEFIATRPDPTGQKDTFSPDADVQSLAWLAGSWASQETRDGYAITGYLGTCFSARDKVRELVHRGVQYHLDDNADTVTLVRAAGIEAFLIDRPWNRHKECAWRVQSIEQFLDIVAPTFVEVPEMAGETVFA